MAPATSRSTLSKPASLSAMGVALKKSIFVNADDAAKLYENCFQFRLFGVLSLLE